MEFFIIGIILKFYILFFAVSLISFIVKKSQAFAFRDI